MKKVNYLVLCENAFNDASGKATLVNIYDIVHTEGLPFVHPKFCIAFNVSLDDTDINNKEVQLAIKVIGPEKKLVGKAEGTGTLKIDQHFKRGNVASSLDLGGRIGFEMEGTYTIQLEVDGKRSATTEFRVQKMPKGVVNG